MTALEERKTVIRLIGEATSAGARQAPACSILGLSERTVQRWLCGEPDALDGRSTRHYEPSHKLSADERAELLAVANSAEFGHLPPSQIVPRLADQQRYIASESTFYRILREERQLVHRRSERAPRSCSKPRAVAADAPNQLYSWDWDIASFAEAGFDQSLVLEVILVVAASTMTNYMSSVTQPPLEKLFQAHAWQA